VKHVLWALCAVLIALGTPSTTVAQAQSGQVNVNSQVAGAPPTTPASITKPTNGDRFINDVIDVAGSCVPYVTVEIYSNNIFVGSAPCLAGGTFSLQIQLVPDTNVLIAKQRDSLDQYSPDSSAITVYYDRSTITSTPTIPRPTASQPANQADLFRLSTDVVYRGGQTNKSTLITIEIRGGIRPYAIGIDWGDGVYELVSRSDAGVFGQGHVYSKPGQYVIKIEGKDRAGNSAYIQTYALVTGEVAAAEQKTNYGPSFLERVVNEVWHWTWWILLLLGVFLVGLKLGGRRRR
jgi:hypothetical protein